MVEAKNVEQPHRRAVEKCSDVSHGRKGFACSHDGFKDRRPNEGKECGHRDEKNHGDDRYKSIAAKKREIIRQRLVGEFIGEHAGKNTAEDAAEYPCLEGENAKLPRVECCDSGRLAIRHPRFYKGAYGCVVRS